MYRWQQVKALRAQGMKIKAIARRVKLSRNTVRKYLRSVDPPEFHARRYVKKIDSYKEDVTRMMKQGFIGTRIHEELVVLGFGGSLSTVERYIRGVAQEIERDSRITTRVETPPGRQLQYDWKEWGLPVGGRVVKIYVHEAILSFSRKKYYTWSRTISEADVIRAVHQALLFYGGVPLEFVMDNGKQMVISHQRDGAILYNDSFLRFMGLMGMEANPCMPYRARTKGKVERPFYHLQEHLLKGCEVDTLEEFERRLTAYTEKVNASIHATVKEVPNERFVREFAHLRAVPVIDPTLLFPRQLRSVSNDGYLSYRGGFYPVPMRLALKRVFVEPILGRSIRVYDESGTFASEHSLNLLETAVRPPHPEHEEIHRVLQERKEAKRSAIVKAFCATFPDHGAYLEKLREAQGPNLYGHLKEIISFTQLYGVEEVAKTMDTCMEIGAYHKNSVKRFLGMKVMKQPVMKASCVFATYGSLRRDLSVYREVACE